MDTETVDLHLGCGRDYRPGMVNIDINPNVKADIYQDICDFDNYPLKSEDGKHVINFGEVDFIEANHVLEHIPDLITFMTAARDLLKVGGVFKISVPYDLSYGAWQDPTHVRAFNERSWIYYCDWAWYLNWTGSAFRIANMTLDLSDLGRRKREEGIPVEDIVLIPRAVEQMKVELEKVVI
jgi:SAM-dependent methyltransferase